MRRRHVYLLGAAVSAAAFATLVLVANNFYWGASRTPGGDYFLFKKSLPHPFGPLLWATVKPLLLATPFAAGLATYFAVRSWRNARAPGACPRCGYDLTGNVSGVCPECGSGSND